MWPRSFLRRGWLYIRRASSLLVVSFDDSYANELRDRLCLAFVSGMSSLCCRRVHARRARGRAERSSVPFILWLSVTGAICLFRPQIESWLDRPYERLSFDGPRASSAAQSPASLAALPGPTLHAHQLPRASQSAARILVGKGEEELPVYVHPRTLRFLKVVNDDHRPMNVISSLHGELLMGGR